MYITDVIYPTDATHIIKFRNIDLLHETTFAVKSHENGKTAVKNPFYGDNKHFSQ